MECTLCQKKRCSCEKFSRKLLKSTRKLIITGLIYVRTNEFVLVLRDEKSVRRIHVTMGETREVHSIDSEDHWKLIVGFIGHTISFPLGSKIVDAEYVRSKVYLKIKAPFDDVRCICLTDRIVDMSEETYRIEVIEAKF